MGRGCVCVLGEEEERGVERERERGGGRGVGGIFWEWLVFLKVFLVKERGEGGRGFWERGEGCSFFSGAGGERGGLERRERGREVGFFLFFLEEGRERGWEIWGKEGRREGLVFFFGERGGGGGSFGVFGFGVSSLTF